MSEERCGMWKNVEGGGGSSSSASGTCAVGRWRWGAEWPPATPSTDKGEKQSASS